MKRAAKALNGHDAALLQYLSPLGWEHINLTGDYLWRSSANAGKFRRLRPLQNEVTEARGLLADFAHLQLAEAAIRDRIAYRKAARYGLSVDELTPMDSKAVDEMRTLFREVFNRY